MSIDHRQSVANLKSELRSRIPSALDCLNRAAPVCPWCGKIASDAWEMFPYGDDEIEHECGWCELPMLVARNTSVTYSTRKPGVPRD